MTLEGREFWPGLGKGATRQAGHCDPSVTEFARLRRIICEDAGCERADGRRGTGCPGGRGDESAKRLSDEDGWGGMG